MTTIPYATYAQVVAEANSNTSGTTIDTEGQEYIILDALRWVSKRINAHFSMSGDFSFVPQQFTDYYDGYGVHIEEQRGLLFLRTPLLEVTSLTVNNTAYTLNTDYYYHPRRPTPYRALRRADDATSLLWGGWFPAGAGENWQDSIEITGTWGYHTDFAEAWINSNDTLTVGLTLPTDIVIKVNDVDGADELTRTPRFSPGNLIRIDNEYMEVYATDADNNTITVRRGVNGTERDSHIIGTQIDIWQVDDRVNRAAVRWTNYMLARRGAFAQATFDGVTAVQFPADMPPEVRNILSEIPRWEVGWTP